MSTTFSGIRIQRIRESPEKKVKKKESFSKDEATRRGGSR